MHFAITGAHGVGKTTLHAALAERLAPLEGFKFVPEFPRRRIIESGDPNYLSLSKHSPSKQMMFFFDHLVEEDRLDARSTSGVFDRFYVDYNTFFKVNFSNLVTIQELESIENLTRERSSRYFAFYIPIEFDIIPDGLAETDKDLQRRLDEMIRQCLVQMNIPFATLGGSLSERCDVALGIIRRKLGRHP